MNILLYSSLRKKYGVQSSKVIRVCEYVLMELKASSETALSIHLIGNKMMTGLNSQYRGKNSPTDVLSFAISEGEMFFKTEEKGDIFICIPQIKKQAKEYGVGFQEELYKMLVHGILHLFGYDHIKEVDAKKMIPLQEKILKKVYDNERIKK
ncbi:MAG: rRNA maturation RNase YbeY [Candidatus Magasanikbacteria bacterium CG11_big_fil_rev_8_21_14_0_20_39_34]|uniref:Endoribonuclease YbeY n=1 Tax=Candidatus Magasanikbacteria bacterium CG11_big_fil_rev_8_21_14_0_20_39_34 TaxID=1974653 RepID=A0A2H0N726_9BACT|nr:MAG: rRNA maturation RNase YbeY [Candidatus Magasanikbacteria bacterium CG11_big_fil_rev_8_21_14_0_20_39_34]